MNGNRMSRDPHENVAIICIGPQGRTLILKCSCEWPADRTEKQIVNQKVVYKMEYGLGSK